MIDEYADEEAKKTLPAQFFSTLVPAALQVDAELGWNLYKRGKELKITTGTVSILFIIIIDLYLWRTAALLPRRVANFTQE